MGFWSETISRIGIFGMFEKYVEVWNKFIRLDIEYLFII